MGKVLIVDPAKCNGCRSCKVACSIAKEGESNLSKSRIKLIRFPDCFFYPFVCSQCDFPFCVSYCPASAISKNPETGVVEHDSQRCVGCRMCLLACPFGTITVVSGLPTRCDLCGGDPVCVKFCDPGALAFGEATAKKRVTLSDKIREIYLAKP